MEVMVSNRELLTVVEQEEARTTDVFLEEQSAKCEGEVGLQIDRRQVISTDCQSRSRGVPSGVVVGMLRNEHRQQNTMSLCLGHKLASWLGVS